MANKGKRMNWSGIYVSDRPSDVLGLTQAQEAKLSQIIGFVGKDQAGVVQTKFILEYPGTSAPTVTDFASTPIGTEIHCPKLSAPRIYIHKVQSSPAVVGDWYYIQGTQVT